jgi:endonuclease I
MVDLPEGKMETEKDLMKTETCYLKHETNSMKIRDYLIFLLFFYASDCFSQIPPGYYDPAMGLTGTALQQSLHDIIDDHTVLEYNSIYLHFQSTDARPGNVVWDMYSDVPDGTPPYIYHYQSGDECGNYNSEGDCYNREHSWPNSWFGGEVYPMYSDLFHIYPTDGFVNNKRGNYPYGTVGQVQWISLNGSKLGICNWPGYGETVFEPINEYKGDFARSYFYMSVRYFGEDQGWPGSPMTNGSQLLPWALNMLLHWSMVDSVSQKETDRNNAVYAIQGNRNPFIDVPSFAYDLWGYPAGWSENRSNHLLTVYPNPVEDFCRIGLPAELAGRHISYRIMNITGIAMTYDFSLGEGHIDLNMDLYGAGLYLLLVSSDQGTTYAAMICKL